MAKLPNAIPAYQARRKALAAELLEVGARSTTKQLQLALFISDVAVATIYDLQQTIERNANELSLQINTHSKNTQSALGQFDAVVASAQASESDIELNTNKFLAAIANLQFRASCSAVNVEILRGQLVQTMGLMWLELLEKLYAADDRRVFFARIEKLLEYVAAKLPVVGEVLDALKTAAEVYAIRKKQAKDADAYMRSLESYIDAANVYLTGVMAFCEGVDRMMVGAPSPTFAEIQQRIASHIQSVSAGTHATSAHENGEIGS